MMKTLQLYLQDSYLKETDAKVLNSVQNMITLDKTIFYATSGGQPADSGEIISNKRYKVIDVYKEGDEIIHKLDQEYNGEDTVKLILDWEKRYRHMKLHTSIHVISSIAMNEFQARITGNQIYEDYARIDFNFQEWNSEISKKIEERTNQELLKGHEVSIMYMNREDVLRDNSMVKIDPSLLPNENVLRMIKIGNIDLQPDGGTHVKNTLEIGKINIYKIENKGKNNKRMYFKIQ